MPCLLLHPVQVQWAKRVLLIEGIVPHSIGIDGGTFSELLPSWQRRHLLATWGWQESFHLFKVPSAASCDFLAMNAIASGITGVRSKTWLWWLDVLYWLDLDLKEACSGLEQCLVRKQYFSFPLLLPHTVYPECKAKDTTAAAPSVASHIFLANVFLHFHCFPRWQVQKKRNSREEKSFLSF